MTIRIYEKKASGSASFDEVKRWIENIAKRADDARDPFTAIAKDTKEALTYSFSNSNPSKWAAISDSYKSWKSKHGYPVTIGIMTGALKSAMTDQAKVTIEKKRFIYGLNENVTNPYSKKKTGEYATKFNEDRNILDWSRKLIQRNVNKAMREKILAGWKTVKVGNS